MKTIAIASSALLAAGLSFGTAAFAGTAVPNAGPDAFAKAVRGFRGTSRFTFGTKAGGRGVLLAVLRRPDPARRTSPT